MRVHVLTFWVHKRQLLRDMVDSVAMMFADMIFTSCDMDVTKHDSDRQWW